MRLSVDEPLCYLVWRRIFFHIIMNVLQVTSTYYPELQFGGPPQKIHALSQGLYGLGHTVRTVTFNSKEPRSNYEVTFDNIRVQYVPWGGNSFFQVPLRYGILGEAIQQADIVHCYGLYNLLVPTVVFLANHYHRPYLLEPLGMYVPRGRNRVIKRVFHQLVSSWMIRKAKCLIATSAVELTELEEVAGDTPVVMRRNGIDRAAFGAMPDGRKFRRTHNVGTGEYIILYVGRISPIKNLVRLVQAFEAAQMERARLLLVGPMLEPIYADKLKKIIDELDLNGSVHLVGPLYGNDKLEALAAADLFVLPSIYESFGNAAAEAVAAGLPVLLTEGCGISALIDGRAGIAVPPTVSGLVEGMHILLDARQRSVLTKERTSVLDELDWERPVREMTSIYQDVIARSTLAAG